MPSAPPETSPAPSALGLLRQHTGALAVHVFRLDASGSPAETEAEALAPGAPADRALFAAARTSAQQALTQNRAQVSRLPRPSGTLTLLSAPLPARPGAPPRCLSLALPPGRPEAVESAQALLPWAARLLHAESEATASLAETERLDRALLATSALLELLAQAAIRADYPAAARLLADELRQLSGCDRVLIARRRWWGGCQLVAVSGIADLPRRGESHLAAELLLRETIRRNDEILCPDTTSARESLPYAAELERTLGAASFYAAPLADPSGHLRGAWLFLRRSPAHFVAPQPDPLDPVRRLVQAAGPPVAAHLHLLASALPGPALGYAHRLWGRATRRQRVAVGVVCALIVLILACPVPLKIRARTELQPVVRRTVAAPFDALLRRAHAKPGQTVAKDEILAELDGREIGWELAQVIADQAKATKEAERSVNTGDIAASRIAQLEAEGFSQRRQLLEYRQANLQIRAPLAGVVLTGGDLDRAEGVPLRLGETLYEIAPLEQMRADLAVDQADIPLVQVGQSVALRLESEPGKLWTGEITRLHLRADLRDGQTVFLCEATLPNSDLALRPGMKGKAKITTVWRPLVWTIVRRAWNWLRIRLW